MWMSVQGLDDDGALDKDWYYLYELYKFDVQDVARKVNLVAPPYPIPSNITRILSLDFFNSSSLYILLERDHISYGITYEIWEYNTDTNIALFVHRFENPICTTEWANNAGLAIKDNYIYITSNVVGGITGQSILKLKQTPYLYDTPNQESYKKWMWKEESYIGDTDMGTINPVGIVWHDENLLVASKPISGDGSRLWCMYNKNIIGTYGTNLPDYYISDITIDNNGDVWAVYYNDSFSSKWYFGRMKEVVPRRSLRQVGLLRNKENFILKERMLYKYCDTCGTLNTSYTKRCRKDGCNEDLTLGRIWYLIHLGYDNVDITGVSPHYLDWCSIGGGRILIDAITIENMKVRETIDISYEINDSFTVEFLDDYYDDDSVLREDEWKIHLSDLIRNMLVTYEMGGDEWQQTSLVMNPMLTGNPRMFVYADYQMRDPSKIVLHSTPYEVSDHTVIEAIVLDGHGNPIPNQTVGFRFYKIDSPDGTPDPIRQTNEFIPILNPAELDVEDELEPSRFGYSIRHIQNPTGHTGRATCILSRHIQREEYNGHVLVVAEVEGIKSYLILKDSEDDSKISVSQILLANVAESNY